MGSRCCGGTVRTMKWLLPLLLAAALGPSWDIGGRWTSGIGTLQLTQAADGAVTGTFAMSVGCNQTYGVTGRVEGSTVSLSLKLAGGDQPPCAGTQTLKGTIAAGGTSMSLALANEHASSPATAFAGKATIPKPAPTTPAKTTAAPAPAKPAATKTAAYTAGANCDKVHQLCPNAYTTSLKTGKGTLTMSFTAAANHCSDVRVYFSVDGGGEHISSFVSKNNTTGSYAFAVAAGGHTLKLRAEGRRGGCNTGYLLSWGGTLHVTYPAA